MLRKHRGGEKVGEKILGKKKLSREREIGRAKGKEFYDLKMMLFLVIGLTSWASARSWAWVLHM